MGNGKHFGYGLLLLLGLLLALGAWWLWWTPARVSHPAAAGEPVAVVAAKLQDVPVYLDALGTVTPTRSVSLVSQVSGILVAVEFDEGQAVRQGQVLARIDDRAIKAQLAQARGTLAHDQAVLDNARRDLARFRDLIRIGSVSQQTLDTQASTVRQLAGTVAADQGAVQNLEVQLSYCTLTSPVDGVVGLRQVDPGNYVSASAATPIAVITQMAPAMVVFAVAEDALGSIHQAIARGPVSVQAFDRDKRSLLATGTLAALDNQIDASTGTVKVKARFEQAGNALFPNQFVNARLTADTLRQVPVVPTRAIQHGSGGDFLFIANGQKAQLRHIRSGPVSGELTAILDAGVQAGEQVITEGADKLDDGSVIKVVSQ